MEVGPQLRNPITDHVPPEFEIDARKLNDEIDVAGGMGLAW